VRLLVGIVVVISLSLAADCLQSEDGHVKKSGKKVAVAVSFKKEIFPIIQKNCLPCHSDDNFNPSELSLDDYGAMKTGGKNGPVWVAGKSEESILVKKLSETPPFGERMPLNSKKKIAEGRGKWLTAEEIKTIARWIDEGAQNN
jgi:uncharacterized membrane protein